MAVHRCCLFQICLLVSFVFFASEAKANLRSKRSLSNMYLMMKCTTGQNGIRYSNYGCWCRLGGYGIPVDGIDRCCQAHDICSQRTRCSTYQVMYGTTYDWACRGGNPVCNDDWARVATGNRIFHKDCMRPICECDRIFSLCLKRYPYPSTGKPYCWLLVYPR